MTLRLTILNGPNLNMLGVREPEIYGTTTLSAIETSCQEFARVLGASLQFHQTNYEGQMVDWVHEARESADAIIINPAAFTVTSVALVDALRMFDGPVIELHISNLLARDELHRHSIVSPVATVMMCGMGAYGYIVAMQAAARMVGKIPESLPDPIRIGPV